MNIFFDVDDTLIAFNGALRPHVREVFQRLVEDGHNIYVWSGVGIRWEVVDKHGLRSLVTDCCLKPVSDYRQGIGRLDVPVNPDFCVDDHPQLIEALGGEAIRPYFWPDERDQEMLRIYDAIAAFTGGRPD